MTLIAKDSENAAAPSPTAPSNSAPKSSADAASRPQPVALEVPVNVNGVRTVEGSDKREPFSEQSSTVLVFGHGAVIRISALLAPGQLIFLTNEKTKKEVVCQVVKSKSDGSSVGYVELRFTEPAPGFWGMRFPSDTVIPPQPAAGRPAAPATIPAAQKPAPPAPPAPAKTVGLAPPPPPKPVPPPVPAPFVSVTPALQVPGSPAPVLESAPSVPETKIPFLSPVPPSPIAPPAASLHAPAPASIQAPPAPVAAAPIAPVIESKPLAPIASPLASAPSAPSTEELKQQAARLQEQLSSLLFTEAPKPAASIAAAAVPANDLAGTTEAALKILDLANSPSEVAPGKPVKAAAPPALKPATSSLEAEEIKIPSWLAPLARDTAPSSNASASHVEGTNSNVESVIPPVPEEVILSEAQAASPRRPETAVFGGQLLGESSKSSEAPAGKSKTGLFIGIAAGLLLVAGGVWYSHQPGNALSPMLAGNSAPSSSSASAPAASSAASASEPVAAPSRAPAEPARMNPPVESAPAASAPVDSNVHNTAAPSAPAQRNTQPAVVQPRKPSLGDVYLATPAVTSHGASSAPPTDPALEIDSSVKASASVAALGDSHRAGPAAPLPVGGDVKPAKLLKSVPPVYPEVARAQRVAGDVQIDALIDANGNVGAMKVLSGSPLLHQAALDALKQWKYQPAELDGKPTSMHLTITVQFRAQ